MLKRPLTRKLGGIFSYTLSRSVRSHENITSPSAFDHTHVISAALSYDFGNRFSSSVASKPMNHSGTSKIAKLANAREKLPSSEAPSADRRNPNQRAIRSPAYGSKAITKRFFRAASFADSIRSTRVH